MPRPVFAFPSDPDQNSEGAGFNQLALLTGISRVPVCLIVPGRGIDGPGDFTQAALMCAHVALAGCAHPFQRAYRLQYVRGWPALYDLKPVTAFPLRSVRA